MIWYIFRNFVKICSFSSINKMFIKIRHFVTTKITPHQIIKISPSTKANLRKTDVELLRLTLNVLFHQILPHLLCLVLPKLLDIVRTHPILLHFTNQRFIYSWVISFYSFTTIDSFFDFSCCIYHILTVKE